MRRGVPRKWREERQRPSLSIPPRTRITVADRRWHEETRARIQERLERGTLDGHWLCEECEIPRPVYADTETCTVCSSPRVRRLSNRWTSLEDWNWMTMPMLGKQHPDYRVDSIRDYQEKCARLGVNPDDGRFRSAKAQSEAAALSARVPVGRSRPPEPDAERVSGQNYAGAEEN